MAVSVSQLVSVLAFGIGIAFFIAGYALLQQQPPSCPAPKLHPKVKPPSPPTTPTEQEEVEDNKKYTHHENQVQDFAYVGTNTLVVESHNTDLNAVKRYLPLPNYGVESYLTYYRNYAKEKQFPTTFCGYETIEEFISNKNSIEQLELSDISVMIYVSTKSYTRSLQWKIIHNDTFPDALVVSSMYAAVPELNLALLPGIDSAGTTIPEHLLGIVVQYYLHPDRKWYYSGMEQTILRPEMLKRTLESYDSNEPVWLGSLQIADGWVPYAFGKGGIVLSNKMVELIVDYIPLALAVNTSSSSDVFLGKFIWEYTGVPLTPLFNMHPQPPAFMSEHADVRPTCDYKPMLAAAKFSSGAAQDWELYKEYLDHSKELGLIPKTHDVAAEVAAKKAIFDALVAKYSLPAAA